MIKAGHIGVGIIGKEGMSRQQLDFAIGQFRFRHRPCARPLRTSAPASSATTCSTNVVNVLAMYAYTLMGRASGVRLFVQTYLGYNMVFTAFPIILFCVFDQDVDKEVSARSPSSTSRASCASTTHLGFVKWMVETVYVAILVTYLPALPSVTRAPRSPLLMATLASTRSRWRR